MRCGTCGSSDHAELRDGASRRRWALHPDGYVCYRIKPGWAHHGPDSQLLLDEICAVTPLARASLWQYLMTMDLVRTVSYRAGWVDDPLRDLLLDSRRMALTVADHVWLRIVDLDRAIGLRAYNAPFRGVVELTDALCPWNAGTWALDLSTSGGTAASSTDAPQVRLDIVDLGAAFLGGTPLARLAAAGRVNGDPAAVRALGAGAGDCAVSLVSGGLLTQRRWTGDRAPVSPQTRRRRTGEARATHRRAC